LSRFSQRFKSGDFVFMQRSALCSAHQAKANQDDLRNVVSDFAVETTSGSIAAGLGSIQHISVEHLLKFVFFFCILTCNITLLSISVKVRNINVDFCVCINECLLTENS